MRHLTAVDRPAAVPATIPEDAVIDLRDGSVSAPPRRRSPAPAPSLPGSAAAADEATHRRLRVTAVVALAVLNGLDLLTTSAFMREGVPEGNPLAAAGLEHGWVGPFKLAVLAVLLARVLRRPPSLGSTCLLWFVTGVYAMVICVNVMIVRSVGGTLL